MRLCPWPWPRAFLSLASRGSVLEKAVLGLGLGFFCVLGLGLEACVLDSTSDMERAKVASSPADICPTKRQRLDKNEDPFSDFRELDGAQPQTGNEQNDATKEELRQVSVTLLYLRYIKIYETKSILIDCFL